MPSASAKRRSRGYHFSALGRMDQKDSFRLGIIPATKCLRGLLIGCDPLSVAFRFSSCSLMPMSDQSLPRQHARQDDDYNPQEEVTTHNSPEKSVHFGWVLIRRLIQSRKA